MSTYFRSHSLPEVIPRAITGVMPITVMKISAMRRIRTMRLWLATFALTCGFLPFVGHAQTVETPRRLASPVAPKPLPRIAAEQSVSDQANNSITNKVDVNPAGNSTSIQEPPAFGPGSPSFGQPFFDSPGVTPRVAPPPPNRILHPKTYLNLSR